MNDRLSVAGIYQSEVEKEAMRPVIDEARQRGYGSVLTTDTTTDADVCLYSHTSLINQGTKGDLTVIMFHSIDGPTTSSKYWSDRHWGKYDVGFVIGENTKSNWREASRWPQARPTHGVYDVGWPKSDFLFTDKFNKNVEDYKKKLGMSTGKTVLYAPTREGPGKIQDYIESVDTIADNILIKHAPYEDGKYTENNSLQDIYNEYNGMENIYIIEKDSNIFMPLSIADVLVSDESSVLQESILTKTIPVSVTDWPIRDTDQPNYDKVPPFALETSRKELSDTVETIFSNLDNYLIELESKRDYYFSNLGNSSKVSLDVIESILLNKESSVTRVVPKSTKPLLYKFNSAKFGLTRTIEARMPEGAKQVLINCGIGKIYNRLLRP